MVDILLGRRPIVVQAGASQIPILSLSLSEPVSLFVKWGQEPNFQGVVRGTILWGWWDGSERYSDRL